MRFYSVGTSKKLQLSGGLLVALALSGFLGVGQLAMASSGSSSGATTASLDTLDDSTTNSTSTLVPSNIPGSLVLTSNVVATGFSFGDAAQFALLDEGSATNTLTTSGDTITGNMGIGAPSGTTTTTLKVSSSTVKGSIDFAKAIKDSISGSTVTGTINANDSQVTTDLSYLNSLSSTLGAESGTALSITKTTTLNATSGTLDSSGNYVFKVSNFLLSNGTLTINGTSTEKVVINFTSSLPSAIVPAFLNDTLNLTGGITASDVLFNVTSGATLTINNSTVNASFLDPNGVVNDTSSTVDGHIYFGGTGNSTITNDSISASQ